MMQHQINTPAIDPNIAFSHISSGWFPFSADVLELIRSRLGNGFYHANREELTTDLKSDFSLYMYCLRELAKMVHTAAQRDGVNIEPQECPSKIIEAAKLEDLRTILNRPEGQISRHNLTEINDIQALRLRESIFSASAAEVLAENVNLDPNLAYSCGLIRQLGITLIAWNYPNVYRKALTSLSGSDTLDSKLHTLLGFSPTLLGVTLARRWNLSPKIISALGVCVTKRVKPEVKESPDSRLVQNIGETLDSICRISEALARANEPEHYPTARSDWESAEREVKQYLGPKGIQVVFQRAQENCKQYTQIIEITRAEVTREILSSPSQDAPVLERNPFLKGCPNAMRPLMEKLYLQINETTELESNLRLLLHEIIPAAGFRSGCIFMLEPAKFELVPLIKIGKPDSCRLKPVTLSTLSCQAYAIRTAYSCSMPIREQEFLTNGKKVVFVAGSIGVSKRTGVLYLECGEDFFNRVHSDPMVVFKAVRMALEECLGLK